MRGSLVHVEPSNVQVSLAGPTGPTRRLDKIKELTGHVETDTLMGYVRDAELFDDNASSGLLSQK